MPALQIMPGVLTVRAKEHEIYKNGPTFVIRTIVDGLGNRTGVMNGIPAKLA